MKWSCSAVRRRLSEYHDGELTIDQRLAVQEHLRACVACDAEAQLLIGLATGLRAAAARRAYVDDSHVLDGLAGTVVGQLRAEREESFSRTVQRMFEDLHLVWAAVGATAATFACLAITVGIFYFSRAEHPNSLAALMDTMRLDDSEMVLPRQQVPPAGATRTDAVPELLTDEDIMLDTTITREGRVDMASLQLMNPDGATGNGEQRDWQTIGGVLDSVAQARFVPARVGGEPVTVKMFWYVTRTTVVGDPGVQPKPRGQVRHGAVAAAMHAV